MQIAPSHHIKLSANQTQPWISPQPKLFRSTSKFNHMHWTSDTFAILRAIVLFWRWIFWIKFDCLQFGFGVKPNSSALHTWSGDVCSWNRQMKIHSYCMYSRSLRCFRRPCFSRKHRRRESLQYLCPVIFCFLQSLELWFLPVNNKGGIEYVNPPVAAAFYVSLNTKQKFG